MKIRHAIRVAPIRLAIFLLPIILVLIARLLRAEMWCGDGPGTALSHRCTDADDSPAVDAAVAKYRDRWMRLDGVWSVEAGDDYHNRVPNIEVHVEPASLASAKKKIPSSVGGIPVVLVPGEMPDGDDAFIEAHPSTDRAERDRFVRQQKEREKYEPAYTQVVQDYGERWDDLLGVMGIGPKCDGDKGCDFSTAIGSVQREPLPEAQREIPSSVYGVKIVLVPED
jgi:hypothetical protein